MYIVKIYITRERKRSAPKRSLVMRVIVDAKERNRLAKEYSKKPFSVVVIPAYKGAV